MLQPCDSTHRRRTLENRGVDNCGVAEPIGGRTSPRGGVLRTAILAVQRRDLLAKPGLPCTSQPGSSQTRVSHSRQSSRIAPTRCLTASVICKKVPAIMSSKSSDAVTMPDLKKQISELKKSVAEATAAKQRADVKKLRRKLKQLKAQTRRLARTSKASATPAPAAA
jgi:hypothetical protein